MRRASSPRLRRRGSKLRRLGLLIPAARLLAPAIRWLTFHRFMLRRVTADGLQFLVSIMDLSVRRGLLRDGIWEPATTRLLQSQIRPGDTVVDAGAHLGYYPQVASRMVGPNGRVIPFEPDPDLAALLRRNVALSGAENVEIVEAVAFDTKGRHRMRTSAAAPGRTTPTVRLDGLLGVGDRVDVVKLDIDGGEAAAPAGMPDLVASNPEVALLVEHDPWQHQAQGGDVADVLGICEQLGLRLDAIADETTGAVTQVAHPRPTLTGRSVNLWYTTEANP